jgi:hypothetical protein
MTHPDQQPAKKPATDDNAPLRRFWESVNRAVTTPQSHLGPMTPIHLDGVSVGELATALRFSGLSVSNDAQGRLIIHKGIRR